MPATSEEQLRERITLAYDYFLGGEFNSFIAMRSERAHRRMFESKEEKAEMIKVWSNFLEQQKPTAELISLEVSALRATAKMSMSILSKSGSRSVSTLYDLWVFENGDWFLDDANRTSPEYFKR
ncbi:MAG: hypothetical protein ACE5NA_05390 [Nitrospiraceae bacterium]